MSKKNSDSVVIDRGDESEDSDDDQVDGKNQFD